MKKVLITTVCLLTSLFGMAQSTVQCSIEDFSITQGGQKVISLNLTNPNNEFCAFQFDLQLPAGITVAVDANNNYVASLSDARVVSGENGHGLSQSKVGDNTYRFICYSAANSNLLGTDGALVNITLQAASDATLGEATGKIVSAKFTPKKQESVTFSNIAFNVTVQESLKGDVNGDGVVNVADVDFIIEQIGGEYMQKADANNDGQVNVADVDFVIELIK